MINRSRFKSLIGFSKPTARLGLSSFSFTSAAVSQGYRHQWGCLGQMTKITGIRSR